MKKFIIICIFLNSCATSTLKITSDGGLERDSPIIQIGEETIKISKEYPDGEKINIEYATEKGAVGPYDILKLAAGAIAGFLVGGTK